MNSNQQVGNCAHLHFSGDLTIALAAEIKASLLSAMTESTNLRLDLSAVSTIDLALLQLLTSAQITLSRIGGTLKIVDSQAGVFGSSLARAGLPPFEEVQR